MLPCASRKWRPSPKMKEAIIVKQTRVRFVASFFFSISLMGASSIAHAQSGDLRHIHWAIVGGESGPRARPMPEQWVDEIEALCRHHKTAFFFKQWGGKNKKAAGRRYRGSTFDEMPALS